eukprot:TRINITY_DN6150_c0_g1_i1.p1 TRINITY_DN6150_c0_g1~~TRINITY_DN6150_c0_g1_i1.p1  ORF type:complete len:274 (-),score=43.71 TRINITY_DN6150_c0_g1_i1:150-971(-)
MEDILTSISDGIGFIKFNRIQERNTWTIHQTSNLEQILKKWKTDEKVKVIIVTGNGEHFCCGTHLTLTHDKDTERGSPDHAALVSTMIFRFPKPIIAAINGTAIGIGITMTLPMDIRIIAEDAKIGFVFTRRGLIPEAHSAYFLPRLIGPTKAMELCMTGKIFYPKEAPQLFNHVVPKSEVLNKAVEIARDIIVNCAPSAVSYTKAILQHSLQATDPKEIREVEVKVMDHLMTGSEFREGLKSFLEKRKPDWGSCSETRPPVYGWWEGNLSKL